MWSTVQALLPSILVHSSKWQIERQLELRLVAHAPWSLAPLPMQDDNYPCTQHQKRLAIFCTVRTSRLRLEWWVATLCKAKKASSMNGDTWNTYIRVRAFRLQPQDLYLCAQNSSVSYMQFLQNLAPRIRVKLWCHASYFCSKISYFQHHRTFYVEEGWFRRDRGGEILVQSCLWF